VWWRFVQRRLLYPDNARLELHMVIEQPSRAENRITLSDARCDSYGQPLARIHWQVNAEDIAAMERPVASFAKTWQQGQLGRLGELILRPSAEVAREMAAGGGIYHPGGTTRMAASPSAGVVDRDLRVFGLSNLGVCATSVLPTGGGANPTMMLLLLAMRYADKLSGSVRNP
jgi:choline dehydrogenase-like flavoprotein